MTALRLAASLLLIGVLIGPALAYQDNNPQIRFGEIGLLAWVMIVVGTVAKFILFA